MIHATKDRRIPTNDATPYTRALLTRLRIIIHKQGSPQRVKASGSATPYLRFPTARYAFNSERYAFALFFRSSSMRCFRRAFDLPARTQQLLLYWLHCTCEGARALAHARSPGRLFVPYVRTYKYTYMNTRGCV